MSALTMSRPESRPAFHRWGTSAGSASSTTSSLSDDEDAITPCPPQTNSVQRFEDKRHDCRETAHKQRHVPAQNSSAPSPRRRDSWRSSQVMHLDGHAEREADTSMHEVDAQTLWRRMLAVQRAFGCYNSARMDAALDTGEEGLARMYLSTTYDPYQPFYVEGKS